MPSDPRDLNRRAAELAPTLYPELEGETLDVLVRRLVAQAGYSLDGVADGRGFRVGDRHAQTARAALERLFLFDLSSQGVGYGNGRTVSLPMMADAIGAFVVAGATVDEMNQRFPFVEFGWQARAHERGRLVDECWRWRLEQTDETARLLMPLLRASALRPRLRRLLPFTSHEVLLFSRTTGFPYEAMRACARPVCDPSAGAVPYVEKFVPGQYEVFRRARDPIAGAEEAPRGLGTGDAEWAAGTLEAEVPATWGAAVNGTAEDGGAGSGGAV